MHGKRFLMNKKKIILLMKNPSRPKEIQIFTGIF